MTPRLGKHGKGESPKLLIRMPAEALEALKRAAAKAGKTYSDYVRDILLKHLNRKGR